MTTDKQTTLRCQQCKKKLGVMSFTCKCEKQLCISHLPPQEHSCQYDFKKEAALSLQRFMDTEPKASSFERIN